MNRPLLDSGAPYIKEDLLDTISFDKSLNMLSFYEDIPEFCKYINRPMSTSAEFNMESEIDIPTFAKLTGNDLGPLAGATSFSVQFSEPYQEQIRKHKKRRINKKWAKRYGYRTKYRKWRIDEVSFVCDSYGRYDLTGNNLKIVKE